MQIAILHCFLNLDKSLFIFCGNERFLIQQHFGIKKFLEELSSSSSSSFVQLTVHHRRRMVMHKQQLRRPTMQSRIFEENFKKFDFVFCKLILTQTLTAILLSFGVFKK